MAVLSQADREAAWAEFMQNESQDRQPMALIKADLRAAFEAADDWAEANSASFNAAIPLPARNALSPRQKAKLLAMVLQRRYGVVA